LRGWRPIPAALLSHSVLLCSGTEDISLPTKRLQTTWSRPTQGKCFPDKHRSIGKKSRSVKSFDTSRWKTFRKIGTLAPALPTRTVLTCLVCKGSVPYPSHFGCFCPEQLPHTPAGELGALDRAAFDSKPLNVLHLMVDARERNESALLPVVSSTYFSAQSANSAGAHSCPSPQPPGPRTSTIQRL
jgi:hypothetical protein